MFETLQITGVGGKKQSRLVALNSSHDDAEKQVERLKVQDVGDGIRHTYIIRRSSIAMPEVTDL